jgi:uncharacterized 2Fe-2S/4Fe-4S cluster protein (DUF4445 family)
MPHVHFTTQNVSVSVPAGTRLLDAARQAGLAIEAPCDGMGSCGKCRAKVSASSRSGLSEADHELLTPLEGQAGWVLACQSTIQGDIEAAIETAQSDGLKILSDGLKVETEINPWITKIHLLPTGGTSSCKSPSSSAGATRVLAGDSLLATEPGDTTEHLYGLAVDIGTTTLVVALNDLRDGRELAVASNLNPQARYAQDVLSRIKMGSKPEGLQALHGELVAELNRLIGQIIQQAGVSSRHIYEAVFSGNTTMLHLAAGVNPASLGKYPYTPALAGGSHVQAASIGLDISPHGLVYLPPIMSAYVGADITSGILATRLPSLSGVTLFVDIGTNGEMVLATDGELTATSTAAGPAFEGMNIACGMRAGRGAVEQVAFSGEGIQVKTIGGAEPVGVCGSGLLDAIGEMAAHRLLDKSGRFHANGTLESRPWKDRWDFLNGSPIFRLAGPVYLSQKDVRQVQLAKAAIRAGIDLMLRANDLEAAKVDRVLIAGSFGFHLRTSSLIHLGLLPREFSNRVEFVGNTSKTGAQAFLLNRAVRDDLKSIVRKVRVLELANDPAFEKTFVRALSF